MERPVCVSGDTIPGSVLKTLGFILVLLLLTAFGGFLAWAWWTDDGSREQHVVWWAALIGAGCVLACPALAVTLLNALRLRRRLVLGTDVFQIVQRADEVLVQIPYANMAEVSMAKDDFTTFLRIDLQDPNDPRTYSRLAAFGSQKATHGADFVLHGSYKQPLPWILNRIQARCEARRPVA